MDQPIMMMRMLKYIYIVWQKRKSYPNFTNAHRKNSKMPKSKLNILLSMTDTARTNQSTEPRRVWLPDTQPIAAHVVSHQSIVSTLWYVQLHNNTSEKIHVFLNTVTIMTKWVPVWTHWQPLCGAASTQSHSNAQLTRTMANVGAAWRHIHENYFVFFQCLINHGGENRTLINKLLLNYWRY